jgi:hypothetical protein
MQEHLDKLRQNLMGTVLYLLDVLRDPDYQRAYWLEREDIHAMQDVLEDYDSAVAGIRTWTFAQNLASAYRSYGIPVANVLLPVYVAIEECRPIEPDNVQGLPEFLGSSEWLTVVERARAAFEYIDRTIAKDERGVPISYDPRSFD